MELAEIRPFEPQMAEIDLFTMPDAVGVGEPSVRKVKPYISGHVTDGSSTFTFTVNGNESVTVPVDANGNWKWEQNRDITSLANFVLSNANADVITIAADLSKCTTFFIGIALTTALKELIIKSSNSLIGNMAYFAQDAIIERFIAPKLSFAEITTDMTYIFTNCKKLKVCDLCSASISNPTNAFRNCLDLEYINFKAIKSSMVLSWSSKLTEQSVVNLFEAVAADGITLTFHATVFSMIEAQLEIEGSPIYEAYWNSDYDFNYASA